MTRSDRQSGLRGFWEEDERRDNIVDRNGIARHPIESQRFRLASLVLEREIIKFE